MKARSTFDKKPKTTHAKQQSLSDSGSEQVMPPILAALRGLYLGSVEIVVHEGRITYIERREQERVNLVCPPDEIPDSKQEAAAR